MKWRRDGRSRTSLGSSWGHQAGGGKDLGWCRWGGVTLALQGLSQQSASPFCACECSLKRPIRHWARLKESPDVVEAMWQEQTSSTAVKSTQSGLSREKT